MTLDLTGKHCNVIFSAVFVFRLREITHAKMQVFLNQPWREMRTSLILLFGKTKALFGKDAARKKNCVFAYIKVVENERETSELKIGDYVFLLN